MASSLFSSDAVRTRSSYIYQSEACQALTATTGGGSSSSTRGYHTPPPPQFIPHGSGFSSDLQYWGFVRILIVGAGGIGCELLHLLLMSGCGMPKMGLHPHCDATQPPPSPSITILDADQVAFSNLNRQFCFTRADVGRWKSEVAAEYMTRRLTAMQEERRTTTTTPDDDNGGGTPPLVRAVVGRLEDQPMEFFHGFDVFFLAVDTVEARLYLNRIVIQLSEWGVVPEAAMDAVPELNKDKEEGQNFDSSPIKRYRILHAPPLIDCGTEGFQGHCRVVKLSYLPEKGESETPCIECTRYLFGEEEEEERGASHPLCTLHAIPRRPEHCVWYAREYLWEEQSPSFPGEFDIENEDHLSFVLAAAQDHQRRHHIGPPRFPLITQRFVLDLLRRPAASVGFTNAFIAGQAVVEWMKMLIGVAPQFQGYTFYNGEAATGIHSLAQQLVVPEAERCRLCRPLPVVTVRLPWEARDEALLKRKILRVAAREGAGLGWKEDTMSSLHLLHNGGTCTSSSSNSFPLFSADGDTEPWCLTTRLLAASQCAQRERHFSTATQESGGMDDDSWLRFQWFVEPRGSLGEGEGESRVYLHLLHSSSEEA